MLTAQRFLAPPADKGTSQWINILMTETKDTLPEKLSLMKQVDNTAADISFLSLPNFMNEETKRYFEERVDAIFTIEQLTNRVTQVLADEERDVARFSEIKRKLRRLHAGLYNFIKSASEEKLTPISEQEFRTLIKSKLLQAWESNNLSTNLTKLIHNEIVNIYRESLRNWRNSPSEPAHETEHEFAHWQQKASTAIRHKIFYGDNTLTAERNRLEVEALILKLQTDIEFFGENSAQLQEDLIKTITHAYQKMILSADFRQTIDRRVNKFVKAYPEDKNPPHIEAFQNSAIEALFTEWRTNGLHQELWTAWLKEMSSYLQNAIPKANREAFDETLANTIIENFKAGKYGEDVRYSTIENLIKSLPNPEKEIAQIHRDMGGLIVDRLLENIVSEYRPATGNATSIEVHHELLELSLQPLREQLTCLTSKLEKYGVTVLSRLNTEFATTSSLRT